MRFETFFSQQACKPAGWFGRWIMSTIFDLGNARLNRFVHVYSRREVEALLMEAGFKPDVRTDTIRIGSSVFHCTVAKK